MVQPAQERALQRRIIQLSEQAGKARFARRKVAMDAAAPVSRKAQSFHLGGRQVARKSGQIPLTEADFAHHRANRHRHQAAEAVTDFARTPLGKIAKKDFHLLEFFRPLATVWRTVLFTGLAGGGQIAAPEDRARSRLQFPHPKLFGLVVRLVKILARTLETFGLAQKCPTAGLISRAAEALRIDERFGHQHGMMIGLLPIRTKPLQI